MKLGGWGIWYRSRYKGRSRNFNLKDKEKVIARLLKTKLKKNTFIITPILKLVATMLYLKKTIQFNITRQLEMLEINQYFYH